MPNIAKKSVSKYQKVTYIPNKDIEGNEDCMIDSSKENSTKIAQNIEEDDVIILEPCHNLKRPNYENGHEEIKRRKLNTTPSTLPSSNHINGSSGSTPSKNSQTASHILPTTSESNSLSEMSEKELEKKFFSMVKEKTALIKKELLQNASKKLQASEKHNKYLKDSYTGVYDQVQVLNMKLQMEVAENLKLRKQLKELQTSSSSSFPLIPLLTPELRHSNESNNNKEKDKAPEEAGKCLSPPVLHKNSPVQSFKNHKNTNMVSFNDKARTRIKFTSSTNHNAARRFTNLPINSKTPSNTNLAINRQTTSKITNTNNNTPITIINAPTNNNNPITIPPTINNSPRSKINHTVKIVHIPSSQHVVNGHTSNQISINPSNLIDLTIDNACPPPLTSSTTTSSSSIPNISSLTTNRTSTPIPRIYKITRPKLPPRENESPSLGKPKLQFELSDKYLKLEWGVEGGNEKEIKSYEIFTLSSPDKQWKEIGKVEAIPLPMVCCLELPTTPNTAYVIRGIDNDLKTSPYSNIVSVSLEKSSKT